MPLMLNFVPMPQSASGNLVVSLFPPADGSHRGFKVIVAARRLTGEETEAAASGAPPEDAKVAHLPPDAKALVDDVTPPGERRWYAVAMIGADGSLKPGRFKVAEGAAPEGALFLSGPAPAQRVPAPRSGAPASPAYSDRGAAGGEPGGPSRPPAAPAAPRPPAAPAAPRPPAPPAAAPPQRPPDRAPAAGVRLADLASASAPPRGVRLSDLAASAAAAVAEESPPPRRAAEEAVAPRPAAQDADETPPTRRGVLHAEVPPPSTIPWEGGGLKLTGATQTWDGLRIWWEPAGGLTAAYEVVIADHPLFDDEIAEVFAGTHETCLVRAHANTVTCVIDNVTPSESRAYYAVLARGRDKTRRPIPFQFGDAAQSGRKRAPFAAPDKLDLVRGQAEGMLREARAQLHWARQDHDEGARREALRLCQDALTLYPDYPPAKALLAEVEAARVG